MIYKYRAYADKIQSYGWINAANEEIAIKIVKEKLIQENHLFVDCRINLEHFLAEENSISIHEILFY